MEYAEQQETNPSPEVSEFQLYYAVDRCSN